MGGHFNWKREGKSSYLEPTTAPNGPATVPLAKPAAGTKVARRVGQRAVECQACDPPKRFGTAGSMAMHFKKAHADIMIDKNSFREHLKEVRG